MYCKMYVVPGKYILYFALSLGFTLVNMPRDDAQVSPCLQPSEDGSVHSEKTKNQSIKT